MKKLIASIIILLITTTISLAQTTEKSEVNSITNKTEVYSKLRAKVIKLNHKKSNDLTSIKAYRKSLQIKVKTVKLC